LTNIITGAELHCTALRVRQVPPGRAAHCNLPLRYTLCDGLSSAPEVLCAAGPGPSNECLRRRTKRTYG